MMWTFPLESASSTVCSLPSLSPTSSSASPRTTSPSGSCCCVSGTCTYSVAVGVAATAASPASCSSPLHLSSLSCDYFHTTLLPLAACCNAYWHYTSYMEWNKLCYLSNTKRLASSWHSSSNAAMVGTYSIACLMDKCTMYAKHGSQSYQSFHSHAAWISTPESIVVEGHYKAGIPKLSSTDLTSTTILVASCLAAKCVVPGLHFCNFYGTSSMWWTVTAMYAPLA